MDNNIGWSERAARLFCIIAYTVASIIFLKYLMPPLLPLLCALFISWGISSLSGTLAAHSGIPRGVWAFFIVSSLLAAVCFALFFALRALLGEISSLLTQMSPDSDVFGAVSSYLDSVPAFEYAEEELREFISGALSSLASGVSGLLSEALRGTPRALIGGFVFLMCVYYMSVDFDSVRTSAARLLPHQFREYISRHKGGVVEICAKYLRANLIIFCMTFFEAAAGLLIICPEYSIIGALAVAAVDILPVFGAGAVLIPWGIIELLGGKSACGIGLLVLYLVISIVRRIAEPKILGKAMGIHPLAALICMYAGYRFFGVLGMLLAPFVAAIWANYKL